MTKKVNEISLGNYTAKATKDRALGQITTMFSPSDEKRAQAQATVKKREKGLAMAKTRTDRNKEKLAAKAQADRDAADLADRKNLPALMKQYQDLLGKFKALGGDSYQYADRMNDRDYEARALHHQVRSLQARINKAGGKLSETFDGEYDDEAGMAHNSLETIYRATKGLSETIKPGDNLPEWCQEKLSLAEDYLVTVWDYLLSEKSMDEAANPAQQAAIAIAKKKKKGMKEGEMDEWKKSTKAPMRPKNPVAKAHQTVGTGSGAHKDKKKTIPRKAKHKKSPALAESATYERRLNVFFEAKKLTEQIRNLKK
jgi:hypothetical protein